MSGLRLHRRRMGDVGLQEAVQAGARLDGDGMIAMLYGPGGGECVFALVGAGGSLVQHPLASVELDRVFELRAFSEAGELRWARRPGGLGTAYLLSERDLSGVAGEWEASDLDDVETRLDGAYLVWGERRDGDDGWARHFHPRTGSLWVPYRATGDHGRAWVHSREYVVQYRHGNLAVAEELLVAISDREPVEAEA